MTFAETDVIDWTELLSHLAHLGAAFALALPVAWNREHRERSAGLRTFPLVALASCAFVRTAMATFGTDTEPLARVFAGLITGVGFIGGGAILKSGDRVKGTATASGLWCTGALGAAVALERYEIALLVAALTFVTLAWLGRFKPENNEGN
ncbi:MAG: magnesium transporter MgtC [Planctomycetota bacterium]|nr:MAG: magnesium transporter MgtC [Planctomycetota bacterium]